MSYRLYHYNDTFNDIELIDIPLLLEPYDVYSKLPFLKYVYVSDKVSEDDPLILITTDPLIAIDMIYRYNLVTLILYRCDITDLSYDNMSVEDDQYISPYHKLRQLFLLETSSSDLGLILPNLYTLGYIPSDGPIDVIIDEVNVSMDGTKIETGNLSDIRLLSNHRDDSLISRGEFKLISMELNYHLMSKFINSFTMFKVDKEGLTILDDKFEQFVDNLIYLRLTNHNIYNESYEDRALIVYVNEIIRYFRNLTALYAHSDLSVNNIFDNLIHDSIVYLTISYHRTFDNRCIRSLEEWSNVNHNIKSLRIYGINEHILNVLNYVHRPTTLELLNPCDDVDVNIIRNINIPNSVHKLIIDLNKGCRIPSLPETITDLTIRSGEHSYVPLYFFEQHPPDTLKRLSVEGYTNEVFRYINRSKNLEALSLTKYRGNDLNVNIDIDLYNLVLDCGGLMMPDISSMTNLMNLRIINPDIRSIKYIPPGVNTIFSGVSVYNNCDDMTRFIFDKGLSNSSLLHSILDSIKKLRDSTRDHSEEFARALNDSPISFR